MSKLQSTHTHTVPVNGSPSYNLNSNLHPLIALVSPGVSLAIDTFPSDSD